MVILGIDIGSTKISAVITQKNDKDYVEVLGIGEAKSEGIKKGLVTNIESASKSIGEAVKEAKDMAGVQIDKTVVSISGSYIKTTNSYGVVNIPNREIGFDEINRVMQMADYNSNVSNEYEKIHVIPYDFKVDKQDNIDDPIGMNGSRIEVRVHIISANSVSLSNLKKAIKKANIEVDNFVFSGYAASLSVLDDDERRLGVCLIDLGGNGCNLTIITDNRVKYSDFLEVGSQSITSDLAQALHTPLSVAEEIKIKYATLKPCSDTNINIPKMGDDDEDRQVSLESVLKVMYARVEETIMILAKILEQSDFKYKLGAGIVLTGGMSQLSGLQDLINAVFGNMSVRIANPKKLNGVSGDIYKAENSAVIGLNLYEHGYYTPYEIDSSKKLRHKNFKSTSSSQAEYSEAQISISEDTPVIEDNKDELEHDLSHLSNIKEQEDINKDGEKAGWFSKIKASYQKLLDWISGLF